MLLSSSVWRRVRDGFETEPVAALAAGFPSYPVRDAPRTDAEAILTADRDRFRQAADVYRELEMPYEEARCRIESGGLERARELAEGFAFWGGPLGEALSSASRSNAT